MDDRSYAIFMEAIKVERNMAALYKQYCLLFPEDFASFNALWDEEEHHAAILAAARDHFYEENLFPVEALDGKLENLMAANRAIEAAIADFKQEGKRHSKQDALHRALEFEQSSQEYCLQQAAHRKPESLDMVIFQSLATETCNHVQKIRELMEKYGFDTLEKAA